MGQSIEPHTFVPDDGIEAGIPHHFMDEAETRSAMACFRELELYHMKHHGLVETGTSYISAHWVFVGEK